MPNTGHRHNSIGGFTIIELLVTVVIMVLSLGMAIAGYLQFERVQRVQQTARDVQQLFAETRKKAQSRDQTGCLPSGAGLFGAVTAYSISIIGTPLQVTQVTDCLTNPPASDPSVKYPPANRPLPSSISIAPNGLALTYKPLSATASLIGCVSPCQVAVSDGSISYGFTVSSGGQIGNVQKL